MEAYESLLKNLEAQMHHATEGVRTAPTDEVLMRYETAFNALCNAVSASAQEIENIAPEQSKRLSVLVEKRRAIFDKAYQESEAL